MVRATDEVVLVADPTVVEQAVHQLRGLVEAEDVLVPPLEVDRQVGRVQRARLPATIWAVGGGEVVRVDR